MSSAFPEMMPNTVIETNSGKLMCINWVTDDSVYGYWFALDDTSHKLVLADDGYLPLGALDSTLVRRIYGSENIHDGAREPLRVSILEAILNEHTTQCLLWESLDVQEDPRAKTTELPKIEPGMVLRAETGYFLVLTVNGDELTAYHICGGKDPEFSIGFDGLTHIRLSTAAERIISVYKGNYGGYFSVRDLHHIYAQNVLGEQWCIYDKAPVEEVTMAEVCEKFGHKVKIVKEK